MKYPHVSDESYVLTYIVVHLFKGETLDARDLQDEFGYRKSSVYKLLRKIKNNIELLDPEYQVVHIAAFKFKLEKSDFFSDGAD